MYVCMKYCMCMYVCVFFMKNIPDIVVDGRLLYKHSL